MFLTDPLKFIFALIVIGMVMTVFECDGTMNSDVSDKEQTDLSGEFEGIGAHLEMREDGAIQIKSPIEGGPAESAGIKPGDIILSVDGESLEGSSLTEAVSMIRGPQGSSVELLVKHVGQLDPVLISVVRDVIAFQR